MCVVTLKSDAKFEEKPICCFRNDKNLFNFDLSYQVSKICFLIGPFLAKYINFDLKKYRGVIFHDTEELCTIWRKTDLRFGKWHEKFGKLSPEHLEVQKLGLLSQVENPRAKSLQGSYVQWHWRMKKYLKRNWLVSTK